MDALAVALAGLVTLAAFVVGLAKTQGLPASIEVRDRAAIAPGLWSASGWVEIVVAFVVVIGVFAAPRASAVGAALLALSYAALATRQLQRRLPLASVTPTLLLVLLSASSAGVTTLVR